MLVELIVISIVAILFSIFVTVEIILILDLNFDDISTFIIFLFSFCFFNITSINILLNNNNNNNNNNQNYKIIKINDEGKIYKFVKIDGKILLLDTEPIKKNRVFLNE